MAKHTYENEDIAVYWDSQTCIHSAVCIRNLGKVFDISKKPWINVSAGTPEEIQNLIHTCPSGALSYEVPGKTKHKETNLNMDTENLKVTISENGPYLIKGNFVVEDAAGNKIETKETAALCRCGASTNKPFCDGAHRKIDFKG
jgi:uncharacterized Fe-S cluster protein YjdI